MSRHKVLIVTVAAAMLTAQAAVAGISFIDGDPVNVSPRPEFAAIGDLNGDGRSDVVVVSPSSKEVSVYLAADTPSRFANVRVSRFGEALRRPALGDLNADGKLDLVVADQGANGVHILFGKGDGTFDSPRLTPLGSNPYAVAIADFDGVAGPDLAIADQRLGRVIIRLNDGGSPPSFRRSITEFDVGQGPEDIRAFDLNQDGKADIVTLNLGGLRGKDVSVSLFRGIENGKPAFEASQRFAVGETPSQMVVADLNNDGISDVAMINRPVSRRDSDVDVMLATGAGTLLPPVSMPVPCPFTVSGASCRSLALAAADFDGNGSVDLAVGLVNPLRTRGSSRGVGDAMQIFAGRGDGTFISGPVIDIGKTPLAMITGDIAGDAKPDVAIASRRTLDVQAFVNVSTPAEKGNGEPCVLGEECVSARCTNGRCCASQCAEGERCDLPEYEGICTLVPPGKVNCTDDRGCRNFPEQGQDGFCVDGLCCMEECETGICNRPGFEGLCIPGIPLGETCSEDRECESRFCDDNTERCCREECADGFCDEQGVCRRPLPPGDPCDLDAECGTDICDIFNGVCCMERCDALTEDCNENGDCELLPNITGTPGTPTATPTQAPVGGLCSGDGNCVTGICENGVCCAQECDQDEHCEEGTGACVGGPPPPTRTPTRTSTRIPTATPGPCDSNEDCPSGWECANGLCVTTSRSGGGCSTGGGDAPAGGNLLLVAALPLALWFGRRLELRRALARVRHQ